MTITDQSRQPTYLSKSVLATALPFAIAGDEAVAHRTLRAEFTITSADEVVQDRLP